MSIADTMPVCPKCGWVPDYSCGCPDGTTTFPLVDRATFNAEIKCTQKKDASYDHLPDNSL
ncbi:hypothetical protein NKJ28_00565 [Mesorhizobium sp. M0145]|uniref:hypothetical protein n=1 Tax=Mesorhizobium sp. M0145 TaxID=2956895 RepID=UPI003338F13A